MNSATVPRVERLALTGEELLARVKAQVDVGNVRRVVIKTDQQRTLIEIPLPIGIRSDALEPIWAAVRSLGDSVPNCSVVIEREVAWPMAAAG